MANVKELTVRKNKFLFYPLVSMASNLQILNIFFKEFTFENQDLLSLKFLKEVNIKCLAKVNKYQPLKHEYF